MVIMLWQCIDVEIKVKLSLRRGSILTSRVR